MIDEAILTRYIEESSVKMNEQSQKQVHSNLRQLFNSDVPYDEMKRQDFIDVFARAKITSSNTFYPYKSKMIDFMLWMKEEGYGTDAPLRELQDIRYEDISRAGIYDVYYFADYNDLFQAMNVVLINRSEFETFKVAATMVWLGIKLDDAVCVKKSDFDENAGTLTNPNTGEIFTLPPVAVEMFRDYKYATSYESNKFGGTVITYQDSIYLLRTYKSGQISKKSIARFTISVNDLAKEVDKKFHWNSIYFSGICYRLHEYELANGKVSRTDSETLSKFFPVDNSVPRSKYYLYNKYDEYCEFRDYIYT